MKGKLLVLGILILVAIIFVPSEEKCKYGYKKISII